MFSFRLCEHLGYPHPDYLLSYLSAEQFLDWFDYCQATGFFGHDRNDIYLATLISQVTNPNLKKGVRQTTADNFLFHKPKKEQTQEETIAAIKGFFGS